MKKLSSPFPWVGGKRLLREHIISLIPDHRCYIEAFAGGAWVYWGKEPSTVDVINDIDGNPINLYRQIKDNTEAFYDKLWYMLVSRDEYHHYLKIYGNNLDYRRKRRRYCFYIRLYCNVVSANNQCERKR